MAKTVVAGRGMPGKENEMYTLYDDNTFLLHHVRGSYVHVGRVYQGKPDKKTGEVPAPKFTFTGILEQPEHEKSQKLIMREIGKLLKANNIDDIKADNKCLRDGNQSGKPEYKGAWTLNMSERENRRPALRGIDNSKINVEHMGENKVDAMFPSGYYFDVLGKLWFQKDYGTKVNCNLLAVKVNSKAETFGEGGITDEDVDDVFGASEDGAGFDDAPGDDDL